MEVFYFGDSGRQLYGAFHEASGGADHGVVLAYPGPQEYMQSHYMFRMLAGKLARVGIPVLRFDWFGTGDSAGGSESASLQQWRDDLQTAIQELKDVSGVRRVSVVGFRLGASVAASTRFAQPVQELILWEPVIDGDEYLRELRAREGRNFGNLLQPPPWWSVDRPDELLGHTVGAAHHAELSAFNLTEQIQCAARHVHIVTRTTSAQQQRLLAELKQRRIDVALEQVDDSRTAIVDDVMLLAGATVSHIVDRLKAV